MSEEPDRNQQQDWNAGIIAEFRANGGKVGGTFEGAPMILVHHHGRKSGAERVSPMVYRQVGEDYAVFASKAGAPTHPDWYYNLMAHPDTTVEVGERTVPVTVREAQGEEREQLWTAQKQAMPNFAEYEVKAAPRQIPVLVISLRD